MTIIPLAVPTESDYTPPPVEGPVLFVGRLERLKGVDQLIRAAPRFLGACPSARLRFVGPDTPTAPTSDDGENSMRAWMLRQLPAELRSRVEFTGELASREVTEQIRGARFLALPSVVENFSLVAAQALGMGRTCVFSDDIGTAEIYGGTGVTAPNGDAERLAEAMEMLWRDGARVERLSRAAWERAGREFNRESVVARQLAFYERTVAAAKSGRRDLTEMPARLAGALVEPLVNVTRFVCGVTNGVSAPTPGRRLLSIMERIAAETGEERVRVMLYGAGRHSARLMTERNLWSAAGHEVVGFVDDGKRWESEREHLGLPVAGRGELMERVARGEVLPAIVLSTDTFAHQFWEQTGELRASGVRVYRLYG